MSAFFMFNLPRLLSLLALLLQAVVHEASITRNRAPVRSELGRSTWEVAARGADGGSRVQWPLHPSPSEDVLLLGEGVGVVTYGDAPSGDRALDHKLRRRILVQDVATLVILVATLAFAVLSSCVAVYRFAEDRSPALYYSDPISGAAETSSAPSPRTICTSADASSFLRAFNTQPRIVLLRIVGMPRRGACGDWASLTALARSFELRELARALWARVRPEAEPLLSWGSTVFDVSLDLAPFVTGDGRLASEADTAALESHLQATNPLQVLVLRKRVEWPCLEEVAEHVRQRLRTLGFPGEVDVRLETSDAEVPVYRNHPWQNFARSHITQALALVSIVGGLLWFPYVWACSRTVRVESGFSIGVDSGHYWEQISDGLHAADGFRTPANEGIQDGH